MNFFQHQDRARRKTSFLIIIFILTVIALTAVAVLSIAVFWYYFVAHSTSVSAAHSYNTPFTVHLLNLVQSPLTLWCSAFMFAWVGLAFAYKYHTLSRGGQAVAEELGGKLLNYDNASSQEKVLLNVVEEMAIAAGNPVPRVYLLEESGINAFAAGTSRRDAVIGVTKGCLEALTRDELQGVIAHEFSHIFNGDMRINLRLVAMLHGIIALGLIGRYMLRGHRRHGAFSIGRRRDTSRTFPLALAFILIGFIGTLSGAVIRAAVSRQREFLADASAVQFTRDPTGISGALAKISAHSAQATLTHPASEEFSHMFFGQSFKTRVAGVFATHPPLGERIKRLDPNLAVKLKWNVHSPENARGQQDNVENERSEKKIFEKGNSPDEKISQFGATTAALAAGDALSQEIISDQLTRTANIEASKATIQRIPKALYQAAHESFSARAAVYAVVLGKDAEIRDAQIAYLNSNAHPRTMKIFEPVLSAVSELKSSELLPLLDICIPSLKSLSEKQFEVFYSNLQKLIEINKRMSLLNWCVIRIISKHYRGSESSGSKSIEGLHDELRSILSLVSMCGPSERREKAFLAGKEALDIHNSKTFTLQKEGLSLDVMNQAMDRLEKVKPLQQPCVLKAIAATICEDGKITSQEATLYRAIAESLNCPAPPLTL